MGKHIKALVRAIAAAILLGSLSGCLDYPQITTLASSMQKNVGSWQPFVDDYAATCKRRVAMKQVLGAGEKGCEGLDEQSKQIGQTILVLNNYFGALAAVATDSNFTVDSGIDAIGSEAKALKAASAKVDPIAAIAKTLGALYMKGEREKAMRKLVGQTDNVASVISGLQDIFDNTYKSNLDREAGKWREIMDHAAVGLGWNDGAPKCEPTVKWINPAPYQSSAQQLQFQQFYTDQCYKINARRNAVVEFDKSAKRITTSLDALNKTKLSDKAALEAFYAQAKTLVEQAEAIQKAFNPTSTNS